LAHVRRTADVVSGLQALQDLLDEFQDLQVQLAYLVGFKR
jgi:hypothetical protein